MSLIDKLLGRGKKAAGDVTGDASLRREGTLQEHEAKAREQASQAEERAKEELERAAQHRAEREMP